MSQHRFPCADDDCYVCQSIAEGRAADVEPERTWSEIDAVRILSHGVTEGDQ